MNTIIDIERFEEALVLNDIGKTELAKRVGCTPGAIYQIASGHSRKSRLLPDISRELHVSIDWLLGKSEYPDSEMRDSELTQDEEELFSLWRQLDRDGKTAISTILRTMIDRPRSKDKPQVSDGQN